MPVGLYQKPLSQVAREVPLIVNLGVFQLPIRAEKEPETRHVEQAGASATGSASPTAATAQSADESLSPFNLPFFTIAMLDVLPRVVGYGVPKLAQTDDPLLAGKVTLRVSLGADGSVKEVRILDAGGLPESFSRSAVDALRRTDFEAGMRGGKPVPVQFTVVVKFGQDEGR